MAPLNRINLRPNFREDHVPCDGTVGDLIILTKLDEGEFDSSQVGMASLWVCTKSAWDQKGLPAVWARVQFDGYATCEFPVSDPPQDLPPLAQG